MEIGQTPSAQLELNNESILKLTTNENELSNYYKKALQRISFSHFVELFKIKDATQRQFYESLILKNATV